VEREKKDCILRAAVRAFEKFGFKKASVDEIARDAGVAKGTVYLAAESKEDLLYQALHREVRSWVAEISTLMDPRKKADELLVECAQASLQKMHSKPLVRDLFLGVMTGQLPGWADRLDELRGLGRSYVEEILRLGVKQGVFRDELDVEEVATVLQDVQLIGCMRAMQEGLDGAKIQRRLKAGLDLVLNGLRAKATSSAARA
jgi:AcrR family transcriptional regulator